MKVHRTIGQRIDGRAIWVNIFFTTSFNCLRFASTSLVASFAAVLPRTSRGRPDFFLPFPPPVRSQFSRNDRSKGVERERVDLEKIWIRISRLTEISIITREPANFSVPDNFLLLLDPSTDHRPGLNLDAFIESLVIFIASWSIDK